MRSALEVTWSTAGGIAVRVKRTSRSRFTPVCSQQHGRFTTVWDSPPWPRDTEAFHASFERGGLQAEDAGSAAFAADAPGGRLQNFHDVLAFQVFERLSGRC